ncbi:hypothetical protein [Streptomyces sp. NBC_00582]|uniref:hypothetical protein n=1 Tax=Streptomyces sp. NBC_00582 TaxID=2975783 RepID=UPI0010639538|nr:hypothetical protein [Streptomyces sp. NBC_00582]WUB64862.1 hypothetical protein OG852_32885 [Streptomyces sp. NBC_00582]
MNGERHADGADELFERQLRELLVRDADIVRPAPAPYPAIRRQGMAERRRRMTAVGAALVALTVVPVGAYAWAGGNGGKGSDTAAPMTSASAPAGPRATEPSSGPGRPASDAQLLDGITFTQAAKGLQKCLDAERVSSLTGMPGKASGYRIILAAKSTGDSNSPGDGFHVVAVRDKKVGARLICNVKDGEADGVNISSGDAAAAEAGVVVPDPNGADLYMQSVIDKGKWKLPFRWAAIGYVDASVTRVTVSYGDSTVDPAVLDHGWYIAYGTLNKQVELAPHVMGYDAAGKLVYDSDTDTTYDRALP